MRANVTQAVDEGVALGVEAANDRPVTRRVTALARTEGDAGGGAQGIDQRERAGVTDHLAVRLQIGDPHLREETYLHLEAGLEGHHGRFDYALTLFRTRADDYVFLATEDDGSGRPVLVNDLGQRPGEGGTGACGPDDGGDCRFRNRLVFNQQADARFHGAELALGLRLGEGPVATALRASADRVRGRLASGGDLPRITPPRYGLGFDAGWRDWSLGLDLQRVMPQRRVAAAESPTDGFTLVGFDLRWTPEAMGGNTQLFLRGRNLRNVDGRLHQGFFKDEAPILGRAITAGVRIGFGG